MKALAGMLVFAVLAAPAPCRAESTINVSDKYAYGANVGWVNFETNFGKPKVNLLTGDMDGYI